MWSTGSALAAWAVFQIHGGSTHIGGRDFSVFSTLRTTKITEFIQLNVSCLSKKKCLLKSGYILTFYIWIL